VRLSFEFSDAALAGGVPADRLKAWLKRGVVEVSDFGGRGTGNRRKFHLLDIAAIRLTAMLTDEDARVGLGLGLKAAREIVQSALYHRETGMPSHGEPFIPAEFETQAVRVFQSRWLVAGPVHNVLPDLGYWQAHLGSYDVTSAADAAGIYISNPRKLPVQKIIVEIGPALRDVARTLIVALGKCDAFPEIFSEESSDDAP